ncbi:MAG TPA: nitrogen regulation protein NR(I) [Castellaniella sp.]|nr:nitrogen regulation protein NR(I) [Castellaniella sp.]
MSEVWIVDDEKTMRWVLEKALTKEGMPVRGFSDGAAVLDALDTDEWPSVVLTDVRMPGRDGLALMTEIKARAPSIPIIIMTAFTDLETTVAAFQHGAFDYLAKPFDVDTAILAIQRAARERTLVVAPGGQASRSGLIPSRAPAMQEVFRAIGRLAASRATVLITGESGTGKELIARAVHQHSQQSAGPFIAVNAAAIPRDLLEAELFGHERGAFTGAVQARRGRFEEARGGTLFLDEIGDMPAELQTRLLRVLAEGSFYRVGGTQALRADVRVVAATHQPLEQRVAQGGFREDLFHRLNVIRLRLPPLRERREDIADLAAHFLRASANELGVPARLLSVQAQAALQGFDYPGNIRQLENICQWLTVMTPGQTIEVHDLPPEVLQQSGPPATMAVPVASGAGASIMGQPAAHEPAEWLSAVTGDARRRLARQEPCVMDALVQEVERAVIRAALEHSHGRRGEAARRLGIGRNTLTRKCKELGLDPEGPA